MKLLVITRPDFFPGEAEAIDLLFRLGLDTLHLRKPSAPVAEVAQLLRAIPERWHRQIMLHDVDLTAQFALRGLHLNARRPQAPVGFRGCLSVACHSLDELAARRPTVDYCFLSPIYDSISKPGYASRFSRLSLLRARADGLLDERVVAMGGVTLERIPDLAAFGFGGVALLGDVWGHLADPVDFSAHFARLVQAVHAVASSTSLPKLTD
jgi:thiamine-phosphate pyrophosphorylase